MEGTIVGFTKAVQGKRSLEVDLWHVKFPEDPKIYKWAAIMLASFEQGPSSQDSVDLRTPVKGPAPEGQHA